MVSICHASLDKQASTRLDTFTTPEGHENFVSTFKTPKSVTSVSHLSPPYTSHPSSVSDLTWVSTYPPLLTTDTTINQSFIPPSTLLNKDDWRAVVKLLMTPGSGKNTGDPWKRWEEAMLENVGHDNKDILPLVPVHLIQATIPIPQPQKSTSATLPSSSSKNHSYPHPRYRLNAKF